MQVQSRLETGDPLFLPGKLHGQRSLVGYRPWGHSQTQLSTPKSNNKEVPNFGLFN